MQRTERLTFFAPCAAQSGSKKKKKNRRKQINHSEFEHAFHFETEGTEKIQAYKKRKTQITKEGNKKTNKTKLTK